LKILFLTSLLLTSLLSYEKGDLIPENLSKHIGLNDNKVYVIDFFASWCGSCKKEIPLISKLYNTVDRSQVEFIGIDVDKDVNKGIAFQNRLKEQNELTFNVINDPQNRIIKAFKPLGMPTLYYIKNKKVIGILTGAVNNIDSVILKDLKKFGAN